MLPPHGVRLSENCSYLKHSAMKFDNSNKFDLCHYVQVNSLRLISRVASKEQVKTFWSAFILQAMVQ